MRRAGWPRRRDPSPAARGGCRTARAIAAEVEDDNRERRDRHEKILKEVLQRVEADPGAGDPIVLGSTAVVCGRARIVASRLVATYHVPVVLVSLQGDVARGSARTPRGHDCWLGSAMRRCARPDTVRRAPAAAGVSMHPSDFGAFRTALLLRAAPGRGKSGTGRRCRAGSGACDL